MHHHHHHHHQQQKEGEAFRTTLDTFAQKARAKPRILWCFSRLPTTAQSRRLRMCRLRGGGRRLRSRFVSWGRLISILMVLLIIGFELVVLMGGTYSFSVYDMLSFCCMFKLRIQYYSFTTCSAYLLLLMKQRWNNYAVRKLVQTSLPFYPSVQDNFHSQPL